jgi:hypothetical protein
MISFSRRFAMFVAVLGLTSRVAQAEVTITITQVGSDVVASGSGSLDITDLTSPSAFSFEAAMNPKSAAVIEGVTASTAMDQYSVSTNPSQIGTGLFTKASTGSGNQFGVEGATLLVPTGYVSGSSLSALDTYAGQTFSSLGLTPGTYTWTWGTGAHADSLIVQVGPAGSPAVPEPSTAILALSGAVAFMTYGWTRRRHQRRQVSA